MEGLFGKMTTDPRNTGGARPDTTLLWSGRLLFAATLLIVTDLALQPGYDMPASVLGSDKLEHIAAFATLALLARIAWPRIPRWATAPVLMIYGAGIEIAQAMPAIGRTASFGDLAADAVGVTLGLAGAWFLNRITRSLRT